MKIHVVGDHLEVVNLLQTYKKGSKYDDLIHVDEIGGVERLKTIIELVNSKINVPECKVISYCTKEHTNKRYYLYQPHSYNTYSSPLSKEVWRIKEELGQETNQAEVKLADDITYSVEDILVFDDLNLNSPIYFQLSAPLQQIFIKTTFSDSRREWFERIAQSELAKKTTVLLDSSNLRRRNISINSFYSWDYLVESLIEELKTGFIHYFFKQYNKVVIYFQNAGVCIVYPNQYFSDLSNKSVNNIVDYIKLYFNPRYLECEWNRMIPGIIHGDLEILTSFLIAYFAKNPNLSDYIPIKQALKMIRYSAYYGKGEVNNDNKKFLGFNEVFLPDNFQNWWKNENEIGSPNDLEMRFELVTGVSNLHSSWFYKNKHENMYSIDNSTITNDKHNILENVIGSGYENAISKGIQIMQFGIESELLSIPLCKFNNYISYDKDEILKINTIKGLIEDYIDINNRDKKPLAIAVFGKPGMGKSYIIKELMSEYANKLSIREYNLSQVSNTDELNEIYSHISNSSKENKIPIVFWDEFDTNRYKFIPNFLQPLQDGFYSEKEAKCFFQKTIFVFCGSKVSTFSEFEEETKNKANGHENEKSRDFISRIRAYLDVKNVNPDYIDESNHIVYCNHQIDFNYSYVIRRAVIIRGIIERTFPSLIDKKTNRARITNSILQALLRVRRYNYGARSIENLLKLCQLKNQAYFGECNLPPKHLLDTNVSDDFSYFISEYDLDDYFINSLTKLRHEAWFEVLKEKGFKHDQKRVFNNYTKIHPYYVNFNELKNYGIFKNFRSTYSYLGSFYEQGYIIKNSIDSSDNFDLFSNPAFCTQQFELQHEKWIEEHEPFGWTNVKSMDGEFDENYMHDRNMCEYDHTSELHKHIVEKVIGASNSYILQSRYRLVKAYNLGYNLSVGFILPQNTNENEKNIDQLLPLVLSIINEYRYKLVEMYMCANHLNSEIFSKKLWSYILNLDDECTTKFKFKIIKIVPNESTCWSFDRALKDDRSPFYVKIKKYSNKPQKPKCNRRDCNFIMNYSNLIFNLSGKSINHPLVLNNIPDCEQDGNLILYKRTINNRLELEQIKLKTE